MLHIFLHIGSLQVASAWWLPIHSKQRSGKVSECCQLLVRPVSLIMSGCDYVESLPGIGIKRAHNVIKKVADSNGDVREVNI